MSFFTGKQKLSLLRSFATKSSPAYVQFYITSRCNLACEQCNIIYADAHSQEMSLEQIEQMAINLSNIGVCIVLLIGGEPFVRNDIAKIVKAFTNVGIHVRMQTNGIATEKQLTECVAAGGHDISISLDSLQFDIQDQINGGFTKSWDNAIHTMSLVNKLFPENGTAFFNTVLMPKNLFDMEDLIKFATAIGWGVSIVPVHTTSTNEPKSYRTFDDKSVVTFEEHQYSEVKKVIQNLKILRKKGYNVYDSDDYLDDVYRFVVGEPLKWRQRNNNVCDSPNLYFAIAPNGNLKVCCDYEILNSFPAYDVNFPDWYRSGIIHKEVYNYTNSCNGCMYGSYPEITVTSRFLIPMLERFLYFNVKPPKLKKLTPNQLKDIAHDILFERTGKFVKKELTPYKIHNKEKAN